MTSTAAYQRTQRRARKAAGQCLMCKRPRMENPKRPGQTFSLCKKHKAEALKRDREFKAKRTVEWERLGLCVSCGQRPSIKATIPEQTDKRCGVCAEQQADCQAKKKRERRDAKRAAAWAAMLDELKLKNIGADCERRTREAA